MKKRILLFVLVVILVTAGVFAASAANTGPVEPNDISQVVLDFSAGKNPVCPYCGVQPENGWIPLDQDITGTETQELNGHYYLTGNRTNSADYAAWDYDVCVYIGDYNITASNTGAFQVDGGKTLTIMGRGTVSGNHTQYASVGGTIDMAGAGGTLNLCGGTYVKSGDTGCAVLTVRGDGNNVVNMYDGTVIENGDANNYEGGNVRLIGTGTFNMYGGTITGGASYCGGNVALLAERAQFYMFGGSIVDGKAQLATGSQYDSKEELYARGGNVYVQSGTFTQSKGAVIAGGTAYTGGNIFYDSSATMTISGSVSGGSGYTAGNIDLRGSGKLVVTADALISGGSARYDGGNIQVYYATLELNGGTIAGGTAGRWGGSIMADGGGTKVLMRSGKISGGVADTFGGNLYVDGGAQLEITGGTITGGKATNAESGRGGNIYVGEASVNLTGAAVTMGQAYVSGGNIHFQNTTKSVNLDQCEISHGQAAAGGNICVFGVKATNDAAGTLVQLGSKAVIKEGVSKWVTGSDFAGGGGNIFCNGGEMHISGQVSLGTANLTGGNLEVRDATVQLISGAQVDGGWAGYDGGNIVTNSRGILVISDSSVTGGTAVRNGSNIYAEGTVVLEATAYATDNGGVYMPTGRLSVYGSFDGEVALSGLELPEQLYGAQMDSSRFSCKAPYPGKICLTQVQDKPCLFGSDGKLFVGKAYTVKDGIRTWYLDNAAAVTGYGDADYLVPSGDLELTGGNFVIDLAGQNLKITGSGRIQCFDSSNDTYKTYGSAVISGPVLKNALAQTVAGKQYVRIKSSGVYTFHRIDLKISGVSLRVSSGGLYYTAQWECDDKVAALIQGFGIGVSLVDMPTESLRYDSDTKYTFHGPETFVSGIKTNGVLIRDILLDHNAAADDRVEKNSDYGKMPIYAKAYVILDNGIERIQTFISQDEVAVSLHDVITSIDNNMPHYYSSAQNLQAFIGYWAQNGLDGEEWDFEFHVPIEILQLQQEYSNSQQLTGQIHDRLEETADLQAWKDRMDAENIDFATCLENGTVSYITSSAWDSTAFIGGIDARFTVGGKNLDCQLLFANKADLESVLTGSGAFTYTGGNFQTKPLSAASFVSLIETVKAKGGLVILSHPKDVGLIDSRDALDYWFADGMAIDISSQQNYKLWTDLLTEGKQVWAIANNAGSLNGKAQTVTLYAEEKNAAAMLGQLSSGDYAVGGIGMHMAVGSARMGESIGFTGEKLVVCIEQAASGVLHSEHTYRVDLITKTGAVKSWDYNGRAIYEIMDAENQAFYRLEVVDVTTGERIAVSNPIWNGDYGLKVGFARENITPNYTVLITGGKQRVSKGVKDNDGIFLTCVALREGDQTYLIFTADLINASSSYYTASLKHAVSDAIGIPTANIRFSTTHTHSSVGASTTDWSLLGAQGETNRQRFLNDLNAAAVRAAQTSIEDLTAVDSAYTGSVTGKKDVAFVRHYVNRDGSTDYSNEGGYGTATSMIQAIMKGEYKAHATEADNEIQLIQFQRVGSKKDVIMMSVPAHATLNENSEYLSADFPQYARTYIESNTDSLVAYFIGSAGDQVPKSKLGPYYLNQTMGITNNTDAVAYGQKLGKYVVAQLESGLTQLRSTALKLTHAVYEGQIGTSNLDKLETARGLLARYEAGEDVSRAIKSAGFVSYDDLRYTVYRGDRIASNGQAMNMNFATMAIGDVAIAFAPYEMAGANGTQLKSGSPYVTTFLATCSDDGIGYVASQDAFDHTSYEAQCTWFAPGSGESLANRYIEVLEQMKYNLK